MDLMHYKSPGSLIMDIGECLGMLRLFAGMADEEPVELSAELASELVRLKLAQLLAHREMRRISSAVPQYVVGTSIYVRPEPLDEEE